jgi:hypothetical protein
LLLLISISTGSAVHGPLAVMQMPSAKELDDLTAVRIVGLNLINPFDGIATAECEEWIAAPSAHCFKAAERATGLEVSRVSADPSEYNWLSRSGESLGSRPRRGASD